MRLFLLSLLCTPLFAIPFTIPTAVHKSTSADIPGTFTLFEDTTTDSICPTDITHTSWREFNSLPIVQHNFIIVNGVRCASTEAEEGGKTTTFYNAFDYTFDLQPVSPSSPLLPAPLAEVLSIDGANINAWTAARSYGEEQGDDFLFGYDDRLRICGGQTIFPARTTTFLLRPFFGPLTVRNLVTPLETGYKWMIIVPTFKGGSCLYRSGLPPVVEGDEDDVMASLEPSPEEKEMEMGEMEGSAEPTAEAAEEEEGPACFPADARVELRCGAVKRM